MNNLLVSQEECFCHKNHLWLYKFKKNIKTLLSQSANNVSEIERCKKEINKYIKFIGNDRAFNTNWKNKKLSSGYIENIISIDCKRFLLKSLYDIKDIQELKKQANKTIHISFPWGEYGVISGHALIRDWRLIKYEKLDTEKIYLYWRQRYIENCNWKLRGSILEGFKRLTIHCTIWDNPFWDTLEYFIAPFRGYIEVEAEKTEDFIKAIMYMIEILLNISRKCSFEEIYLNEIRDQKNNVKDHINIDQDTLKIIKNDLKIVRKKIVDLSLILFDLVNFVPLESDYKEICFKNWNAILIDHTLEFMDYKEREGVKETIKSLRKRLSELQDDVKTTDTEMRYINNFLSSTKFFIHNNN